MKTKTMLAAFALATIISCKKNEKPVSPEEQPLKFKEVTLKLSGDFDATQSPLGRKAGGDASGRRVLRDSTVYMIRVHSYMGIYGGVFTDPDNIQILIPEMESVGIFVQAIRRGSGGGLYYTWRGGLPYYGTPVNDTLHNRMERLEPGGGQYDMTFISHMPVTRSSDTSLTVSFRHPELDIFRCDTSIEVSNISSPISLQLERKAFGLEVRPQNFIAGRLIVSFSGQMAQKEFTPADIPHSAFIYSAQEFLGRDTVVIPVRVVWERPNGIQTSVGEKNVTFRRNALTKISFSLDNGLPADVKPVLIDTTWTGVKHVIF